MNDSNNIENLFTTKDMSVLSDVDIKQELGKKILIFPFNEQKIRGGSINLSASSMAWDIKTKKSIYNSSSKAIIIPKLGTALIQTEEIIHVTNAIAGTFHSKVGIVSQGLGHISTTLDPGWIGNLLIAVHNHTDEDFELPIGDTFVTLTLYYVNSKSEFINNNKHGRPDVLIKFDLSKEEKHFFDDDSRTQVNVLKKNMLESKSFIDFNTVRKNNWYSNNYAISIYIFIIAIVVYMILNRILFFSKEINQTCLTVIATYTVTMVTNFILARRK